MHAIPAIDLQAMMDQAKAKHAQSLHAITHDPVQQHIALIAATVRGLDDKRRQHYEQLVRRFESDLAAGRITETEAVTYLQRLGEEAHREAR